MNKIKLLKKFIYKVFLVMCYLCMCLVDMFSFLAGKYLGEGLLGRIRNCPTQQFSLIFIF